MSGPIYHLWIVHGFHEAYYQLSQEGHDRFWANAGDVPRSVGAKSILACDSRWCNEAISAWGIDEYPDLLAVQKAARLHEENQHFRYIRSESILGTKIEGLNLSPVEYQDPLYQLFLIKNQNNEPWHSLAEDARDRMGMAMTESMHKMGAREVIGFNTYWSTEEYSFIGVLAWPNVEAEQAHFAALAELEWNRYTYARTILGVKLP